MELFWINFVLNTQYIGKFLTNCTCETEQCYHTDCYDGDDSIPIKSCNNSQPAYHPIFSCSSQKSKYKK